MMRSRWPSLFIVGFLWALALLVVDGSLAAWFEISMAVAAGIALGIYGQVEYWAGRRDQIEDMMLTQRELRTRLVRVTRELEKQARAARWN